MRAVTQRVLNASVRVNGDICGQIDRGVLVLLGFTHADQLEDTPWMVQKLIQLRQFCDEEDKINLSLKDIGGSMLVVSQFTLYANCSKGRRPSFVEAAAPEFAEALYEKFLKEVKDELGEVQSGIFGAKMEVSLTNDGPLTFVIEK